MKQCSAVMGKRPQELRRGPWPNLGVRGRAGQGRPPGVRGVTVRLEE